jgi:DHA1 family tetracycline resistance protein-like MFS transporter
MGVIYFTVFLDLLGFGILIPNTPYFAQSLGATGLWLGALMTAYSAAQFVGAPIIGSLSDRYGRRPILLLAIAGSGLSMAISGFATSLGMLLGARIFAGFFGGSIAAAQAYIADVTTPETRAKKMGLLGASIGLGFVFGPALGAALADFGFPVVAWTAASLNGVNLLWGFFKIKEPRVLAPREKEGVQSMAGESQRESLSLKRIFAIARMEKIRPVILATFFASLGFVSMETTYALLGAQLYQLDSKMLGVIFTLLGVVMVIVQGGLVGRLSKRLGSKKLAFYGMVLHTVSLALMPFAPNLTWSVVCQSVLAAGQGLISPSLSTILSKQVDSYEQGKTLGIGQSLAALARGVGPMIAGFFFDLSFFVPYLVAGCLGLLAVYLVTAIEEA